MAACMTSSCVLRRIVFVVLLPLLAAPLPVSGATARPVKTATTAPKPLGADTSIIALPLNPVVPAAQRLCAARTPSGLGYTMLRPAVGPKPAESDLVLVDYIGYLAATGVVFDQGVRSALAVNGVIPGFSQGLRMMARTGIARFCIPAAMGYGAQAAGPIPANADLVFQVELVDYKPTPGPDATPMPQTAEPSPQSDPVPKP